jgi:hypothetical protein
MKPPTTQPGFPTCISLSLEFNQHANYYLTAQAWIKEQADNGHRIAWVSAEERQRAIDTDSIWMCQWYPITPVGSYTLAASTFDTLMAAVLKVGDQRRG